MSKLLVHYVEPDSATVSQMDDDDPMTWDDAGSMTYPALVATVHRLQNELHALASQIVQLRQVIERCEGDL